MSTEPATDAFVKHRQHLFDVAYRMLGSVGEAEDIVQEAFVRWQQANPEEVRSARAYLTTVTTRLAIDRLRSAQRRGETYVGPWLPEPPLSGSGFGSGSGARHRRGAGAGGGGRTG